MRWKNQYSSGNYSPLNEECLRQLYTRDQKSTIQIGRGLGCSHMKVVRYLKRYGIKARDRGEAIHLASRKTFSNNARSKNYIDGLIMGDGSIVQTSKWSAYYIQGMAARYELWAHKIKKDFQRFGIDSRVYPYQVKARYINGISTPTINVIGVASKSYTTFIKFRRRWYPNGEKHVPQDIEFTPQMLANWYMGDGSYSKRLGCLYFHTHSLSQTELIFVRNKFKDEFGYVTRLAKSHNGPNQFSVRLLKRYAQDLLHKILQHKAICFDYKWPA